MARNGRKTDFCQFQIFGQRHLSVTIIMRHPLAVKYVEELQSIILYVEIYI